MAQSMQRCADHVQGRLIVGGHISCYGTRGMKKRMQEQVSRCWLGTLPCQPAHLWSCLQLIRHLSAGYAFEVSGVDLGSVYTQQVTITASMLKIGSSVPPYCEQHDTSVLPYTLQIAPSTSRTSLSGTVKLFKAFLRLSLAELR